ncbi:hypothetical protein LIA77_01550 [Sarocladium implicatum]|nr:hypothetical protein LIA77_01550 [Sarocladium implicatum]
MTSLFPVPRPSSLVPLPLRDALHSPSASALDPNSSAGRSLLLNRLLMIFRRRAPFSVPHLRISADQRPQEADRLYRPATLGKVRIRSQSQPACEASSSHISIVR